MGWFKRFVSAVTSIPKTVEKTVQAIVNNPLPVIETVALTAVGVPVPVATAAVAAANGAPPEKIATAAIASYAGGEVGTGTAQTVQGAVDSSTLANITGSAAGSAAKTLIQGGNLDQAFANAVVGAAGQSVKEALPSTPPEQVAQAQPPAGVQVAGPAQLPIEVSGAPLYAESPNAASYKPPFGYQLMSASQADAKPEGAFYDVTTNAWLVPDTKAMQSVIDVFQQPAQTTQVPPQLAGEPAKPSTDVFVPETPAQTGGTAPISAPQAPSPAPVSAPVAATPSEAQTPTPTAPQGISIPDQISQVSGGGAGAGGGAGGGVGDTGTPTTSTDQRIIDLISQPQAPVEGTLPEVTIRPEAEAPAPIVAETPTKEPTAEIPEPPSPKVDTREPLFITGGVAPKISSGQVLAQVLGVQPYTSLPTTGLTAARGAGEIESSETGGKRQNVWNEASLRLKDALGL